MFGVVIYLAAFLSIFLPSNATPLRDTDLEQLIDRLQRQTYQEDSSDSDSSSADDSDDTRNNGRYLRTEDVLQLIKLANQKNYAIPNQNGNSVHRYHQNHNHKDDKSHVSLKNQHIEQLLQEERKLPLKKPGHNRLTPNKLLGSSQLKDDGRQYGGLNEYSKIFVILDPEALQKSRNSNALTSLISRILSQSSAANVNARPASNKKQLYKGFPVNDIFSSRRYRRYSKESYGGRDSMEDDYKPKRSRNDGGAGGTGGRTAIPYIRHRGDIYEREH